jgi:GNAT superfamily N-acetyltransferase
MQATAEINRRAASGTVVREARPEDGEACARIFYEAFEAIAGRHSFPVEPSSRAFTRFKVTEMLASADFAGLVAERDGEVLASAFVDRRASIVGIGPVTVDPAAQDGGIGRILMEAVLDRERGRHPAGLRLVQTAYHYRSLALYAKLGFVVREPLSVLQGALATAGTAGNGVRLAGQADIPHCAELCISVHGHDRTGELQEAVAAGTARVIERAGGICGYATGFGYGWHAVAETNADLIALLGSADAFMGLGILVPSRNAELLRWCLGQGLRIVQQSTLMSIGLYNEPAGAYLPSILF